MLKQTMMLIAVAALAVGCGRSGGGSEALANSNVTGRLGGSDFDFVPRETQASVDATDPTAATLEVTLCDGACSSGGRMLTFAVRAAVAELRSGGSFAAADKASAEARLAGDSSATAATGGEVVIDSTDLRQGGHSVGTFQLDFGTGSIVGGFFDVPITIVGGDVAAL